MAEGQYERSVEDAYIIENESVIIEVEVKDSIKSEMLMSMNARTMPMGVLDVPFADDSLDLGSLINKESQGLCDGDLAYSSDLEPDYSFINHEDRGMMMNINEAEHVGDRAPMSGSQANHGWVASLQRPSHPLRTSRSGQFNGS